MTSSNDGSRALHRLRTLPLTWAIALGFTLALLVGILILTRDLGISRDIFKDGVAQAAKVDNTTDKALDGADQLPPANDAITGSMPEVAGVVASLDTASTTLVSLGDQLQSLGVALTDADAPLVGIIGAGRTATQEAAAAAVPAQHITQTLTSVNEKLRLLGPRLDYTQSLSDEIDSKLRIALLLPKFPK